MDDIITQIREALDKFRKSGYNIPGTSVLISKPPFFKPVIRIVEIDTSGNTSDVYPVTGGKLAFTFNAIKRFIDAGRIEFESPGIDINNQIEMVTAKVKGKRFDIEGTVRVQEDAKSINIRSRQDEITATYQSKGKAIAEKSKWDKERLKHYVDENVKNYMIQLNKFAVERAISGAQARVVTKLLGMKQSYPANELQKPFVILSVIPDIDMEDQRIKEIVTLHALGLGCSYYPAANSAPTFNNAKNVTTEAAILQIEKGESGKAITYQPEIFEFPVNRQVEILKTLAANKGVSSPLPISQMIEEERKAFYERLLAA